MKLYRRESYLEKIRGFYHDTGMIKVITGLMQTIAEELKENGIPETHIIYINLDKRGYKSIRTSDQFEELLDRLCPNTGIKYLFIDEIQNIAGFEEVLNAFREEEEYSIFITGSNSYLLSGELITKLTGRYIEFELFPLTFDEYLKMKSFLGQFVDSDSAIEFEKYIREGGFPKTLDYETEEDKRTYIHSVLTEIFEKDIRSRFKIRHVSAFEQVQLQV